MVVGGLWGKGYRVGRGGINKGTCGTEGNGVGEGSAVQGEAWGKAFVMQGGNMGKECRGKHGGRNAWSMGKWHGKKGV